MKLKSFLDQVDHERIVAAIRAAESKCRGEIRVHAASRAAEDAQRAAAAQFDALRMGATRERNGVLIYVAPLSQSFAVVGDAGIHDRCGPEFWQDVAAAMAAEFRAGRFGDGIVNAVTRVGEALARHFPRLPGQPDPNEIPDSVSEG